jgi:hypothetical protein
MAPPRRGKDVDVDEVIAAAAEQSQGRRGVRSSLYAWLWDRHDLLRPKMEAPTAGGAAWWDAMAQQLSARGVMDGGRGSEPPKPPTGQTVRQTWWRVVRDREAVARGEVLPKRGRPRKPPARVVAPVAPVRAPQAVAGPPVPSPTALPRHAATPVVVPPGETPRPKFGPARRRHVDDDKDT